MSTNEIMSDNDLQRFQVRKPSNDSAPRQWTLKGMPTETVEVTRDAAKRSGMKLNAWVSKALEQAASSNVQHLSLSDGRSSEEFVAYIKDEISQLRAQTEDMKNTVNSMSSILLKFCDRSL